MKITWDELTNIVLDGIDTRDYPDFCDAYIRHAWSTKLNRELTDYELEVVTDDFGCEINQLAIEELF